MHLSSGKVAVYLTLIFSGGVATGFFANKLVSAKEVSVAPIAVKNNDDWRKKFVDSMRSRLAMNDEQIKKLDDILDETRVEYRLLRHRYKPEMDKIHAGQVERIKKVLTPDQIPEYDKMEAERVEKMRARESGPGF